MEDQNSKLTGRIKRVAKVGVSIGGVAAKMAGKKLIGQSGPSAKGAVDLRVALGGLKGPLMKVAQILSTVPDMLPEEYTNQLMELQTNAPSMGWPFVKRRMSNELGKDWQSKFKTFEPQACNAASLGQVHKATSLNDQALACKLQYPDMASAVDADLAQLKLIFSLYKRYDSAIDPSEIHKELSERLREELNYHREAKHQKLYADMLKDESQVHVAKIVDELSTQRLLTMHWLDGQPLMSFVDAHEDLRNAVATNMFRAWYIPFYKYGILHGDPHLGNYSVREDGSINLLDFGCIRVFNPSFVQGVLDLYHALKTDDQDLAAHAYESWGFDSISKELMEVLNHWASFVYAPIMEDKTQAMSESNSTRYGAQVAAKVHQELRKIPGGVTPPREFLLMDRAAIGLGSVFTHLKAEVNWYRMFQDLVDDFDAEVLQQRQTKALSKVGL
ncbi:MAG: AarF/UbiB family protein [Rhodospirillales bacterium]|nr:AarF/UbiB family protein [Rhodospirillales bacterium]